ncbi:MAG: hypothetical protein U9N02_03310 [Campylobacterota bacterium]|nr:hypothetical protein [Campylobacterota bacterium]
MDKEQSSNWFGWIPTNRGKINFSFISHNNIQAISKNFKSTITNKQITIQDLDISTISDSYKFQQYKKINKQKIYNEITSFANIKITDGDIFKGSIEIYNEDIKVESDFIINSNGKIEFYGYISNKFDLLNDFEKEIQTVMYIIVKTIVHGDSHHHQKIDIALPITSNEFDIKIISESFVDYIKLVEKNIKNQKECHSNLRNEILVYEINGYISYLKTFLILFDTDKELENNLKYAENILISLKSTVEKRKTKWNYNISIFTAIITFLGLFISINILMNGFWLQNENNIIDFFQTNYSRLEIMGWSFIAILFSFYFYIYCTLNSKLYYVWYDGFELINFIKESNYKRLNLRGKLIKSFPMVFFIIFIYKITTIENILLITFYIINLFT